MKLCLVEWVDSCGDSGWHSGKIEYRTSRCVTAGLVVHQNEEHITIVNSHSDFGNNNDAITIPRSCITRIRKLKVEVKNGSH